MDEKKKAPEEEKKPDQEPEKKPGEAETKPEQEQPQETKSGPEKAADDKQADENGEGADKEPEPELPVPENGSELEALKAENIRLKAQLEAHNAGFTGETIEDAVTLAEAAAKRDGTDITTALKAIAKKYPDWVKSAKGKEEKQGGFKVGADSDDSHAPDSERLDRAFGIRKKK